ncbi:hypothetical protein, partial [Corallococcus carmarthensis]|uniref:hypothetical protein n=1 Tax=Corallococcus carmarthensis TaxID=2316728 RepID=UPI00148E8AD3
MYRLCLLGCVLFVAACGEKAPDEGAIRVSVTYGTFKPACVRVEAKDAQGHQEATDIPATGFKAPQKSEVLVAVRRMADWDTAMSITVSSYAEAAGNRCSGAAVETFSSASLTVVPKEYTRFDVALKAVDADGDGSPTGIEWAGVSDCDDKRSDMHPGAVETCTGTEDLNCNKRVGCQEEGCVSQVCDDGNPCTESDRCAGTGLSGLCMGTDRTCSQIATCMETSGTCNKATGACEFKPQVAGASCVDAQTCTINDSCNGSGACISGTPTPCPTRACFLPATSGCVANNDCSYSLDPAQVNTACVNPANQRSGWCRGGDGACSAFPYRPSNFDPDAVDPADIAALTTTGEVTFNTDTLTWDQDNRVTNRDRLKPRAITAQSGNLQVVLFPVSSLTLGGALRFTGSRPIILAVYGDANPGQNILANGRFNGPTLRGAGGNHGQCGSSTGATGTVVSGEAEGGGGGGHATAGAAGGVGFSGGTARSGGDPQNSDPLLLLGGCAGGDGGGTGNMAGGQGGAGGGAFQLSVARTLTLQKALSVSGGGGAGGQANRNSGAGGGGGGGSGGRLIVEAFAVNLESDA